MRVPNRNKPDCLDTGVYGSTSRTAAARRAQDRRRRSLAVERLECRHLLATNLVISEFLAVNDSVFADEDGEFSDWFEVSNSGAAPVNLNGWYATDDAVNLTKWQFPGVTIPAGDQLSVFASNKNRTSSLSELHTNFRLSGGGEYLALVQPDGTTIAFEYAPQFPAQTANVSYGISLDGTQEGFFPIPTPGTPNLVDPVADPERQIVITEIMFHPFHVTNPVTAPGENTLEEYIEIYNHGQTAVDLTGWSFDRGINFDFPQVTIDTGEYLVVAADVPTFQTNYPNVANVVGGWQGKLSNRGEEVRLIDEFGLTIDSLSYADEGDWAVRTEGPNDGGFTGWIWLAEADGGRKTLELINLQVNNEFGQNWAASVPDGGTPGGINSVAATDTAPIILDVKHLPLIPRSSDPVTVTARLADQTVNDLAATLFWRVDGDADFGTLTMHDDGQHHDGAAGDFVYGATIPAQPDETVVEFYVYANDELNHFRTWPAPVHDDTASQEVPLFELGAAARAFVPADDSLGTSWRGGNEPFADGTWSSGTIGVGYETGQVGTTVATPVAYWTFDELTSGGTVAPDARGRYDGTVVGATLTTDGAGLFGEALSFDGDGDYVLPGVISEVANTAQFSVSLWFRRAVDHSGVENDTNHLVNNVLIAQASNSDNDNLEIGTEGNAVEVYLDTVELGGATTTVSQPAAIQNDVWHHLVMSYESGASNELKIYVDGTLVSEHSEYGGLIDDSGISPFAIGLSRPGETEMADFEGLIDDLAVWDAAIDAQQVSALFAGTSPLLLSGYEGLLGLDLENAFQNQNPSAYVRVPFTVSGPDSFDGLRLRMQYDDAFVAYINGTEVARAGVTGAPQWNSVADADRPDGEALLPVEFSITNFPGSLVDGNNTLAIQMLNADAAATRALVLPQLDAIPGLHQANALYQVLDDLASPTFPLVESGATATAFVPTDDSLGTSWKGGNEPFPDGTWSSGTIGVGYESGQVGPAVARPIAHWTFDELTSGGTVAPDLQGRYDGTVVGATLTTGGGGMFGEALSFDGDGDYVLPGVISEVANAAEFSISLWFQRAVDHAGVANDTNHIVNNVLIAQASNIANDNLEIGTEGDAVEVYLDTVELGGATTTVSQPAAIQNDAWHHLVVSYERDAANELKIYVDGALVSEHSEYGGLIDDSGMSPFAIGLSRPGGTEVGDFEGLIDDVAVWDDALDAQHVTAIFAGTSPSQLISYEQLVGLDLAGTLQNQNTSSFIRVPFWVNEPTSLELLRLRMQYDDAFVAYINGTEVARAGFTGTPQWNSVADADRPDVDAFAPEEFLIVNNLGLLNDGQNVLAVQLLNFDAAATRAIVFPELEAVRDTLDSGSVSVYHQTMTAAERSTLETLETLAKQGLRINAQMNATFIALTDTDFAFRYTTGIRLRGNYSRRQSPPNNRINIPSDRPWQGLTALDLNVWKLPEQFAAYSLFSKGGMAAQDIQPIFMYSNGQNLRENSLGGVYAQVETLNSEFAENHFPMDNGGNLYKGRRASESPPEYPPGGQGGGLQYWGTDTLPYVSYEKETNKSAQDWSDIINLTFQLNNSPNETFLADVGQVVNIDQWLRAIGMHEFLNDEADGLFLGFEPVADEYALYRGVEDPRFQIVPFDLDEMFINSSAPLMRFNGITALNRLVNHVDVISEYAAQLWDIANVALTPEIVKSTLADVMGPIGLDAEIDRITSFLDLRRDYLNNFLLAPVSMSVPGGYVDAGTQVTLSSPGTIHYTIDGSDPRLPGGAISPQAIKFTGTPIVINETTKIVARSYVPTNQFLGQWSGQTVGDFVAAPDLIVTELNYHPHEAQPGEFATADRDDFEYVEVMNAGANPIDLNGVKFVQVDVGFAGDSEGIVFNFAAQTLAPGEHIVVVKNVAAFQSRYGMDVPIALGDDGQGGASGEYGGRLSNAGERITLVGPSGVTLYAFDYNDTGNWPERPDGGGSSLELVGPSIRPDGPDGWRGSVERGGTPGSAGIGNAASVVINEVASHNPEGDVDAIELYNPTVNPIDISGMWLSDSLTNLDRYVIPAMTTVPAGGYLILDENNFGFGLSGTTGDDVVLVDPGTAGNPDWFIDHVSFGPALPGESFGRWPDETGNLYPMISTTLGAVNSGPRTGPVVISEVMYNPSSQLLEFVEIYNPTPLTIDLTGWSVDGIGYDFSDGTTIDPGQILVLLPFDPTLPSLVSDFDSAHGVEINVDVSTYLGPYPGRLDNGGETLTLRRVGVDPASGLLVTSAQVIEDQVDYNDMAPWPIEPDGTGDSLQRTRVDLWGNDPSSWSSANPTPGHFGADRSFEFVVGSTVIGEVGMVADLTHEVQTITFAQAYNNPVVLAQPASFNGMEPVVVRVSNIQSNQFDVFLAEPSNLNGIHGVGETISYIVIEAGTHWLSDGTRLEVGTVDTSDAVGANILSPDFQTISFPWLFADTPVILSQPQTTDGELFLSTRSDSITRFNFEVALQPEELFGPAHVEETVGFVAIDSGSGIWNEMPIVAGVERFINQNFRSISYSQSAFATVPSFLASLSSYNNSDNAHLRIQNAGLTGTEVKVEEDTTVDIETSHISEEVNYLAIGGQGLLSSVPESLLDGQTKTYQLHIANSGRVVDVNVNLDIAHSRVEDLDIYLESPQGTIVELLADLGGNGVDLTATIFDDDGAESITAAAAPFTGRFRPTGMLRDYAGENIAGTWTLHVTDDTINKELGALLKWSLDVELGPEPEGNLNYDSQVDSMDIDLLFANLGSDDATYDMDVDGDVDQQDVNHLVLNILGRRVGDADLDLDVDIVDFNKMVTNFDPLGQNVFNGWGQGNFDGDDDVDIDDFRRLVMNFSPLGYPPTNASSNAFSNLDTTNGITNLDRGELVLRGLTPDTDAGTLVFTPTGTVTVNRLTTASLDGIVLNDLLNDGTVKIGINASDVNTFVHELLTTSVAFARSVNDDPVKQDKAKHDTTDRVFQENDDWRSLAND